MAKIAHEPVKRAMSRIRELSADEEARRLAFVRERALLDEVSQLNEARQEGEQIRAEKTASNLIEINALTDEQIAQATGLTQEEVTQLRAEQQG
ncbi:hypothetical protein HH1059_17520 [Halorhodospira halochloris]|uniref:Uncharacterized protein n=1 Tax=Halorhodospira halochloris TaxID=1052 RepID=A0A2Z6EZT3_HALHR|nr:hypothetical protein HH1059_17520 [Halorhodospira halochloris]